MVADARLDGWLAQYKDAWEQRDARLAASLFSAGATYHETPFDAPLAGPDAIHDYWQRVTEDQRDIRFSARPLAMAGETAVAEWSATFRSASSGASIDLEGVFVLDFDAAGLCSRLREWWHVRQR
jgi:hypothetical protein